MGLRLGKLDLVPIGIGEGSSLAASSLAICSGVRFQPTAPRFCRSCSSLRAPMMTFATVGAASSQLKAICGTVLPVSAGDRVDGVDHSEEIFVVNLRPGIIRRFPVKRLVFGKRRAAADLPGEASPTERTPHDRAHFLVERQRHEFPFVVAADERVIGLMRHVAREPYFSEMASDFIKCQPEKLEQPM